MADEDRTRPSLEAPSLRLPRLRRRRDDIPAETAQIPTETAPLPEEPPRKPADSARKPADSPRKPADSAEEVGLGPLVTGWPAALATGVLAGLLLVGATYVVLLGCTSARGTATCGGAAGFPLLLLVVVGTAVLGGYLLLRAEVPSPFGTSALAVGLVAVVCLLFLGRLDEWYALVAVPVLTVAAYAGSYWLTTRVPDDD